MIPKTADEEESNLLGYLEWLNKKGNQAERSILNVFVENKCTEQEQNQLRAFLFVMRNPRINFHTLESIIKKYEDILFW